MPDKADLSDLSSWYSGTEAEMLKYVCTDGGEGSFRVPLRMPAQTGGSASHAGAGPHYWEFLCPYGSQPEACPPREAGLQQYQETMDELEQPSGPAFANCFDTDVPDYECCHAENEFRVHGGAGKVGNTAGEDLEYCAYRTITHAHGLPNTKTYVYVSHRTNDLTATGFQIQNEANTGPREEVGTSLDSCMASCDSMTDVPSKKVDTGTAIASDTCRTIHYDNPDNDAAVSYTHLTLPTKA